MIEAKSKMYQELKDRKDTLLNLIERNKLEEEKMSQKTKLHLPFFGMKTASNNNNAI